MCFAGSSVIAFAKQTGDYAVLSRPDLAVLALAYALEVERHGTWRIRDQLGGKTGQQKHEEQRRAVAGEQQQQEGQKAGSSPSRPEAAHTSEQRTNGKASTSDVQVNEGGVTEQHSDQDEPEEDGVDEEGGSEAADDEEVAAAIAKLDLAREAAQADGASKADENSEADAQSNVDAADDDAADDDAADDGWTTVPSSSKRRQQPQEDFGGSDGEGEWVTSDTITRQKQKDLGLVTDEAMTAMRGGKTQRQRKRGPQRMTIAAMTADYAVQNVLLQMGLSLVSTEGYKISKVRSWVLRCHGCFKITKDSERKFCPHCGGNTLIRTSVTSAAPGSKDAAVNSTPGLQVHLKRNFQYRNRGTIYSLPMPKPGSSSALKDPKHRHAVPVLREDQAEWQRGLAKERTRRGKEEKALQRALEKGKDTLSARYEDPDWTLPGLMGGEGGGRQPGDWDGLPIVGAGRKNPNQARHGRRRK